MVIESCANHRLRHLGRPVNVFFAAATATVGVAIGWGHRIIIFRLAVPAGDLPRLACAGCGHQIPGPRLAPWLSLTPSGRCVARQARTGPPPAAVEISIAALLVGLTARVHPGLVLTGAAWLAVCAVPLAWIDSAVHRLPDPLTGLAYLGTVAVLLLASARPCPAQPVSQTRQARPRTATRIAQPPPRTPPRRGKDHPTGPQPQSQTRTRRLTAS